MMNKLIQIAALCVLVYNINNIPNVVIAENNYLMKAIDYSETSPPMFLFKNKASRCSLLFNKIKMIDIKLPTIFNKNTSVSHLQYDKEIGLIKMIIDNKLSLAVFEKEIDKRHQVDGMYYESHGYHGLVHGMCYW